VPYRAVLDSLDVVADSVSVDSLDVNDSTDAKNTGKEVRDRGFDVSSLLNGTVIKHQLTLSLIKTASSPIHSLE
jgi:hypothetical protein